ncbi:hypothetical protein ACSBR2_017360 [Camellia fascicularis]
MASSALLQLYSLLLLFPLFPVVFAINKSNCNVELGKNLSAGNDINWPSQSGDFAFGFQRVEKSNDGNMLFLLAIWFDKIPNKTIVWSANDGVPTREGSIVKLTKDGGLQLFDPEDNAIWEATTNVTGSKSNCAAMLDTGNFVVLNEDSFPIWESFQDPRDTILPGQILANEGKLWSRLSETNYTNGRFLLHMQGDGNLVMYTVSMPTGDKNGAYWASETLQANSKAQLIFAESGEYIYVKEGTRNVYNFTIDKTGLKQNSYHMARIDNDGVFRLYNHPKSTGAQSDCSLSWSAVQQIPDDVCLITGSLGSGACGYNSYCVDIDSKPTCFCPDGYSPVDPFYIQRGCKPNFPVPSCQEDGWETKPEMIDFKELNDTDWPLADYELQTAGNKETCIEYCRNDCFCAAAIYGGNSCWRKKFPLSNGKKTISLNKTALIKVRKGYPSKKDNSTLILVGSIILGSSLFFNFLLLLGISVCAFISYRKRLLNMQSRSNTSAMNVTSYGYKELEEATGGFKQKLGHGAFGTVYKGVLPSDHRRFVAVKKLDKVVQEGEKEFKTEVSVIGQTHHKNLVQLLGYCDEGEHRLLVYEYMSNGSLASLLFGISRPDWNQRVQIAFGIARGLMYLHEECSTQIIHCDIKPQNILLDEYLTPRISDFGLAKLLLAEQTRAARTGIRGTIGYFAPEWFRKASITVKVDVYSFGMMLLEIICCKSSVAFGMGQELALVDFAYDCYCKRKLDKLVENDEDARSDMKRVERLVMVAIWCTQEDPSIRPSMRKITQMLEGVLEVSVPPRPSIFSTS